MYRTVLIITLEFDAEYLLTLNSYFLLSQNINSVMLIFHRICKKRNQSILYTIYQCSSIGMKCSYWQQLVGMFLLAKLVERLDTQTESPWFESLQWRLIYLIFGANIRTGCVFNPVRTCNSSTARIPQLREVDQQHSQIYGDKEIKLFHKVFNTLINGSLGVGHMVMKNCPSGSLMRIDLIPHRCTLLPLGYTAF